MGLKREASRWKLRSVGRLGWESESEGLVNRLLHDSAQPKMPYCTALNNRKDKSAVDTVESQGQR
jgi:hypothetical protein